MVFEIFLCLPAQVVHEKRHVFHEEWRLVAGAKDFIYNHLWNSSPGIIILGYYVKCGIYVEMRQGRLEICRFDCGSFYLVGCANGLALGSPRGKLEGDRQVLHVFNPLTKQQVGVPYGPSITSETVLAFAEAAMKYKVVSSCRLKSSWRVGLLTVGVDKEWRYIDIEHISKPARVEGGVPFVTHGFVHWIQTSSVLTLNVETEMMYEFPKPGFRLHRYLAMGRNLCSLRMSQTPRSREYLMEIREMNPETGEWTMSLSSDLKPLSDRFKGLKEIRFFGVLGCGEVFVFGVAHSKKVVAAYNVPTREIQWFQLEIRACKCQGHPHVNCMVWLE